MQSFIDRLPKAELHAHIEGTILHNARPGSRQHPVQHDLHLFAHLKQF